MIGNNTRRAVLKRPWVVALILGLTAFGVSGTASMLRWPTPAIHDEFSYLLASDTFVQGRLTNPTHPCWEHFETFQVIHQPSYASKYPPGQGLVLAVGQWLVGEPIVGIWILTALAAVACYWMLLGWVPPRWAAVGGVLFLLHPEFQFGWGQSYWGGTLAFLGGALIFGAAGRMKKSSRIGDAVLMSMGALILAVSRPYEGLVFCLLVGAVVLNHWWRHGLPAWRGLLLRTVLPQAIVFFVGGVCLAYYNQAVTGSWRTMPYQVHESTYALSPSFLWQQPYESPAYLHATLSKFHHGWEMKSYLKQQSLAGLLETKAKLFKFSWNFFFPLPMMFPLLFVPFCHARIKWPVLIVASLAWLPSAVTVWNFPHYVASMVPVLLILVLLGLRQINVAGKKTLSRPRLATSLILMQVAFFVASTFHYVKAPQDTWQWRRAEIAQQLEALPKQHLVLVHYDLDHNSHHEWVYNRADIDGAKIVWARPMGPAKEAKLLDYFHDRTIWKINADVGQPKLIAYELGTRGAHQ